VSIGISPYTPSSAGPDAMLAQADLALYRSKDEGRIATGFHSDDLDTRFSSAVTLAEELRHAHRAQPTRTFNITGKWKLCPASHRHGSAVRWHHPKRGLLPAAAFIEVAEKTGTIIQLGQWVLD